MVLTDQLAWVIHNAQLFQETRELQDELVQSERLAVIGEMSARIAHEIRNPLATIGGFGRSLQRTPNPDRIDTASRIISCEVTRLEELLTDILNYTRPRTLKPYFTTKTTGTGLGLVISKQIVGPVGTQNCHKRCADS